MLNKDCKEMLQCLPGENVEFLLVGAYWSALTPLPPMVTPRRPKTSTSSYSQRLKTRPASCGRWHASVRPCREGIDVLVISLEDLIANQRATGRTQDLADVERLESACNGNL